MSDHQASYPIATMCKLLSVSSSPPVPTMHGCNGPHRGGQRSVQRTEPRAVPTVRRASQGFYNKRRRHSSIGYLSPINYECRHQNLKVDPDADHPAAVRATVKDTPSGGPKMGPSLTAAACDGRTIVRVGTEKWLCQGRTKECHATGRQYDTPTASLIPSPQLSTKPG